eukprot:COSAG02_NODE_7764_length_2857_cov_6.127991_2_plen_91_part_00
MPKQPLLPYWYSYSGNVTASSHSPAAPGPPGHCVDDKQTGSESQQTVTETATERQQRALRTLCSSFLRMVSPVRRSQSPSHSTLAHTLQF